MSDIDNIDYTPLESEGHVYGMTCKRYWGYTVLVAVVSGIAAFINPVLGLGLFFLWLTFLATRANQLKDGLWAAFADDNGWEVNAVSDPLTIIPLSLQFGHDPVFSPAITASLGGVGADIFVYRTGTGEGKYQQTHNFTVARVALPATLPHILLRSKKDGTQMQQDFADHEAMQLEGDFGDYFSLQLEKGQEVDVLEILTPDVMQVLVSFNQHEDIEIGGEYLYFIIEGDDRGANQVRQLIQSVVELSWRIVDHITRATVPSAPSAEAA